MALAHLTVAGLVELGAHRGVDRLPATSEPSGPAHQPPRTPRAGRRRPRADRASAGAGVSSALGVAALLTPLGLLAAGGAFGEDDPAALDLQRTTFKPCQTGWRRYAGFWHRAIFDGYDFNHDQHPAIGYIVSAFVGIAVIALAVFGASAVVDLVRARRAGRYTRFEGCVRVTGATRATPDWLTRPEVGLCPCGCIGRRTQGRLRREDDRGQQRARAPHDVLRRGGRTGRSCSSASTLASRSSSLLVLLVAAATVRNATRARWASTR